MPRRDQIRDASKIANVLPGKWVDSARQWAACGACGVAAASARLLLAAVCRRRRAPAAPVTVLENPVVECWARPGGLEGTCAKMPVRKSF